MKKLLMAVTLLWSVSGFTHAHLNTSTGVIPRKDAIGNIPSGLKSGPCGGLTRIANPPQLQPGQQLTVTWEETIQHPGRFEIYFSQSNEQNFQLLATIPDTQDDQNLPHEYSTTVTLPNVTCTGCTLQLIQVMMENPTSPSMYYNCADMKLGTGTSTTPTPSPTPGTGPSPTPSPTPALPLPPADCSH
jgi:hypothetical protein